jgi:AAA+ ATPase superfamily predicted ATPase
MSRFIGRNPELEELRWFLKKKTASLLLVRGRRRVGKSRLIEEFAKPHRFLSMIGLPPNERTTRESELAEFSRQFSLALGLPPVTFGDWGDAFYHLARTTAEGRVIILLDEISWMGSKDPTFLGKLKTAWDTQFKKNDRLILVLCGSASTWIEKNILSSTGFLGRVSRTLTLEELPLRDCARFWPDPNGNVSAYEKAKVLAVTGGIPRYLEEIDTHRSSEENLKRLCFSRGGLLVTEFEQIFNDLFLHNSPVYKKLVGALVSGDKDNQEISESLGIRQTGRVSGYLEELAAAGFTKRDYTWDIKTGLDRPKQSRYRLSDNYLRFYLKYMERRRSQIQRGIYRFKSLEHLPEWLPIMGLQFENLVLSSRAAIHEALNLDVNSIVNENPYFQSATKIQPGCQIDFMIQSKFSCLYICEIRFCAKPIGTDIVREVQSKIDRLKRPKHFSSRPVLIHINGVTQELADSDYFAHMVDIGELLR